MSFLFLLIRNYICVKYLIGVLRGLASKFWEINGRLQDHESLWFSFLNTKIYFGENQKIPWNFIKFKGKI